MLIVKAARRQMQVEAAERRRQESENRGIKDPEKVRRMQERAAKLEKDELEAAKQGLGQPALRVNILMKFFALESKINSSFVVYFSGLLTKNAYIDVHIRPKCLLAL